MVYVRTKLKQIKVYGYMELNWNK